MKKSLNKNNKNEFESLIKIQLFDDYKKLIIFI